MKYDGLLRYSRIFNQRPFVDLFSDDCYSVADSAGSTKHSANQIAPPNSWEVVAECRQPASQAPLPGTCPGCALWPGWHTEQLQRYLNGQNLILEWKNSSIFRQTSQNNLNSKVKTNDTLKDQNLIKNIFRARRASSVTLVPHLRLSKRMKCAKVRQKLKLFY